MKLENYISVSEYLMGRHDNDPISDKQFGNVNTLVPRVNGLLADFYSEYPDAPRRWVTSGYRPESFNKKAGGSKKSAHLTCQAVDLWDTDRLLADWLVANPDKLKEHKLYLEDPEYTKGKNTNWVHLQTRRTSKRIFRPY